MRANLSSDCSTSYYKNVPYFILPINILQLHPRNCFLASDLKEEWKGDQELLKRHYSEKQYCFTFPKGQPHTLALFFFTYNHHLERATTFSYERRNWIKSVQWLPLGCTANVLLIWEWKLISSHVLSTVSPLYWNLIWLIWDLQNANRSFINIR